jgi:pantetheine-phosphate adenylyltransferase
MTEFRDAKYVLFVASLPNLHAYHHLGSPISTATERALERIAIVLVSPLFNGGQPLSKRRPGAGPLGLPHAPNWVAVQRLLTFAYVQASAAAHAKGRILLDVDVLLRGTDEGIDQGLTHGIDSVYGIEGGNYSVRLWLCLRVWTRL